MPRIEMPRAEDVPPEVVEIWEQMYEKRGAVPYMFRTLAARPAMMRAAIECMNAVLHTGTIDLRTKEVVVVRTSQLNGCAY